MLDAYVVGSVDPTVHMGRDSGPRRSPRLLGIPDEDTEFRTIRAGHSIEYYSPAFVAGNESGHRSGIVVRVSEKENFHYPIAVNTQEVLTRFVWLRRTTGDNGEILTQTESRWKMVRNCVLVDGVFDAGPRVGNLREALACAVEASFQVVRQRILNVESVLPHSPSDRSTVETDVNPGQSDSPPPSPRAAEQDGNSGAPSVSTVEESGATTIDVNPDTARALTQFESILTPAQRRQRHHRGKDRLGVGRTSRKKRYSAMKATSRASKYVYRAQTTQSVFLRDLMRQPHVCEALKELRAARAAAAHDCGNEVSILRRHSPVPWPSSVIRINAQMNPNQVFFTAVGNLGKCNCIGDCYMDVCCNSATDTFCTKKTCNLDGKCSNSLREWRSLELFDAGTRGLGVFTSAAIEVGVIIAEYCGVLEPYEGVIGSNAFQMPLKHNSGYTLLLPVRAKGKFVYIEAVKFGSIARFVNHSCDANCALRTMQSGRSVTSVLVTTQRILPEEEITITYAGELWFPCRCGSSRCVSHSATDKARVDSLGFK
jgi:hypothetical protein